MLDSLTLYPASRLALHNLVKQKANWTCEKCGRPCREAGESRAEFRTRIANQHRCWTKDLKHLGRFSLKAVEKNPGAGHIQENLMVLCSGCHLERQAKQVAIAASGEQYRQLEESGQLCLFA